MAEMLLRHASEVSKSILSKGKQLWLPITDSNGIYLKIKSINQSINKDPSRGQINNRLHCIETGAQRGIRCVGGFTVTQIPP